MAEVEFGVYHKSIHGGKWSFITTIVQKLLNVVTFFILARLLRPSDYGIITVVFLVVGFFDTVTTPGFEKAVMQKQGDVDHYLDTLWTLKLLKSIVIFLTIFFCAPIIASFFHIVTYVSVIRWGATFALINGFSNSREFYFFRNLDFKKLFIRDISTQIGYLIVAISWALWIEASVWALLAGQLTRYFLGLIMSYVLYPQAPRLSFKFSKLKNLWHYSRWVIGQNILGYIIGILDSVYIGHFLDASRLGIYTKSRDLSYAPVSPVTNAIIRVGFPAYSKIQDKIHVLQQGFLRSIDVLLVVTFPVCLLLLTEGGSIVQILLGNTWLGIVVPLKIFSIANIFSTLVAIIEPIFDAVGRPEINVQLNIGQLVSSLVFIYFGVHWWGVNGAAMAMILIWILNLGYSIWHVRRILHLNWSMVKSSIFSLMFAAGVTLAVAVPAYFFGFGHTETLWINAIFVIILASVYVAALWTAGYFFKSGPIFTIFSIVREVRGR